LVLHEKLLLIYYWKNEEPNFRFFYFCVLPSSKLSKTSKKYSMMVDNQTHMNDTLTLQFSHENKWSDWNFFILIIGSIISSVNSTSWMSSINKPLHSKFNFLNRKMS
jgi:hypothetical protein